MSIDAIKALEKHVGPLTLGKLIWAARRCDEIPQKEFAKKLGITKSHLCDIEKGRKSVSPERAVHFAKKLGYPPEQFVSLALQDLLRAAGLRYTVKLEAA